MIVGRKPGFCMLCLQPDASDLIPQIDGPLDDSDEQGEELDRLLDQARADAAAANEARRKLIFS